VNCVVSLPKKRYITGKPAPLAPADSVPMINNSQSNPVAYLNCWVKNNHVSTSH